MKKLFCLILAATFLVSGCKFINAKKRWCESIPDGGYSVICEAAHFMGTEPEEIALGFKLGNFGALATGLYTAAEAMAFVNNLQAASDKARMLNNNDDDDDNISWGDVLDYARHKYATMSPETQVVFIFADDYFVVELPDIKLKTLSNYDFDGIDTQLNKHRQIILPYLLNQN